MPLWKRLTGHSLGAAGHPTDPLPGSAGRRHVGLDPPAVDAPQHHRNDQTEEDEDAAADEDRRPHAVAVGEHASDERSDRHAEVHEEPVAGADATEHLVRGSAVGAVPAVSTFHTMIAPSDTAVSRPTRIGDEVNASSHVAAPDPSTAHDSVDPERESAEAAARSASRRSRRSHRARAARRSRTSDSSSTSRA